MKMLERQHELRNIGQNAEMGNGMKKRFKSWKDGMAMS